MPDTKRIRSKAEKSLNIAVAMLLLSFLSSSFLVFLVWRSLDDDIDDIIATRAESRLATCEADNANAERINTLNDRTYGLLVDAISAPRETPRTPSEQAAADAFLDQQRRAFEVIKVPLRDCSPEGIRRFYEGDS